MAKNSITDYSKTASLNTDIQSVDIDEGCLPSGINNAIRELMADLAAMNDGTVSLTSPSFAAATIAGNLTVDTNTLYVDSTNNRVGIGTTSPDSTLTVNGSSKVYSTSTVNSITHSVTATSAYAQTITLDNVGLSFDNNSNSRGYRFSNNGSERMRITSTGLVGIGTTSPTADLTVTNGSSGGTLSIGNNAAGSTSVRYLQFGESSDYSIQSNANSYMRFYAEGAERMRIDSSGNVGIGTSSPAAELHINDASGLSAIRLTGGASGADNFQIMQGVTGVSNSGLSIYDIDATATRMVIDSSGQVGIGTSSPVKPLTIAVSDTSTISGVALNHGASNYWGFGSYTDQSFRIAKSHGLEDANTYFAINRSNGNVGIGTSSPSDTLHIKSSAPIIRLEDSDNSAYQWQVGQNTDVFFINTETASDGSQFAMDSSGFAHFNTGGSQAGASVAGTSIRYTDILKSTSTTGGANQIVFYNPNGAVGSIRTSGSSTSYNTSSDYRLKENVTGITDGIERVKQLNPSRFNFIADADTIVDGFLAHEAATVVPEAVSGEKDAVDEDGNPDYQGIDQAKLVPLLTAALQEAITKIEDLEARVATLEGN